MNAMISTICMVMAASADTMVHLPYSGRMLNQHELTYSSDLLLVEVRSPVVREIDRKVESRVGPITLKTWIQPATVVDSSFGAGSAVDLRFSIHLQHTGAATYPESLGIIDLPLPAGRYLVLGSRSQGDSITFLSSVQGVGLEDRSAHPPVHVLKGGSAPAEVAVFAVFRTKMRSLPAGDPASRTLLALVQSIEPGDLRSVDGVTDLLVRGNHSDFPEWRKNAEAASKKLEERASGQTPYVAARLLVAAAHMGLWSASEEAMKAIVAADQASPGVWSKDEMFLKLARITHATRTPEIEREMLDPRRQLRLLKLVNRAESAGVKSLVLGKMTKFSFKASASDFLELIEEAVDKEGYAELVASRLAQWFNRPDLSPERSDQPVGQLLDYWRSFFHRGA